MVWLAAVAIGLIGGVVGGGKIENLVHLRFRWPWFVVAALIVRVSVVLTPLNRVDGIQYVYAATLAALVAWTVWQIDRTPGIWLVTAGAALNLLVIAANAGRMPVAPEIGGSLVQRGQIGQYTLMSQGTHLNWLADWIVLRLGPVEIYSAGDLVVALGIAVLIAWAMRSREKVDATQARIVSDPP